ncbi:MAG: radical SAM protein [Candidatus Micrarchaeota archaeon]
MSDVEFVFPTKTKAISLTGDKCSLNCAHCNRHYLKQMSSVDEAMGCDGVESILVSGGCDAQGEVPLTNFTHEIAELKKRYRIIAHTGLFAPEKAHMLKGLVDVVSFDFPSSDRAIEEVYGIGKTQADYIDSLCSLMKEVPAIPHVTIGMRAGVIEGELDALETLSGLGLKRVVLNVLVPTPGTRYANINPPEMSQVLRIIKHARKLFSSVYLGCVRPSGEYRRKLDSGALEYVDRIVMPSKEIVGGKEKIFNECCGFR